MRKLDEEKALETLDQIERLTSEPGRDGGATAIGLPGIDGQTLDLAVRVARRRGGLRLLVERYGASRSVVVVGALALILAERAKSRKAKDARLLFDLVERLQRRDHPNLLVTILTAAKRQIGLAEAWRAASMPDSLYPFLQHCLTFDGARTDAADRGLSDAVQLAAIDLLRTMCEANLYVTNFDADRRRWMEERVREILAADAGHEAFRRDASYFFDCVARQPHPPGGRADSRS